MPPAGRRAAGRRLVSTGGRRADMRSSCSPAFTTRGTSFLTAGAAAVLAGLFLGERDLVSVGVLLLVLPLFSALAAGRARYRLSCVRSISPPRVAAGQTAPVPAAAGERLPAADRAAAGRGHGPLRAGHPAPVRPERHRARRVARAELPAALRPARQVRDRPAGDPDRGRVRPGRARPVVLLPHHAGRHAQDRAAAPGGGQRQLAGRRRRQDPHRGRRRRGRRRAARLPGRR